MMLGLALVVVVVVVQAVVILVPIVVEELDVAKLPRPLSDILVEQITMAWPGILTGIELIIVVMLV